MNRFRTFLARQASKFTLGWSRSRWPRFICRHETRILNDKKKQCRIDPERNRRTDIRQVIMINTICIPCCATVIEIARRRRHRDSERVRPDRVNNVRPANCADIPLFRFRANDAEFGICNTCTYLRASKLSWITTLMNVTQ